MNAKRDSGAPTHHPEPDGERQEMAVAGRALKAELDRLMDARGMSLNALSRASSVDVSLIARWGRGEHRPRRSTLERVAKPLGTTAESLLRFYPAETTKRAPITEDPLLVELRNHTRAVNQLVARLDVLTTETADGLNHLAEAIGEMIGANPASEPTVSPDASDHDAHRE